MDRELRKYIMPNVLAMMGTSCYILADTFFISAAEGTKGIAALNLTLPIYGLIFAIGSMIGVGSATRHSLEKGLARKHSDFYFSNAILWNVMISVLFMLAGILCPAFVLKLMGANEEILPIGISYLRIVLLFTPCFMLNYTFTSFVRNDGAPKIAMIATLSSGFFNIIMDYVLMFPLGMGMNGAALATGFSPIISMLVCCIHYFSAKNTIKFQLCIPSCKMFFASCKLGIVAFVGEIASGITTFSFNIILLSIADNTAVAAYGIVANIALVGTSIFNGVSQGLQPLASQSCGQGDEEKGKRILKQSLILGGVLAVVLVAGVWIGARGCIAAFNQEGSRQLEQYALTGIRVYFLGFLVAAVNIIRAGYLSATGRAIESSIISITRGIVAIVLFALVLSRAWGIFGVWMAFPVAETFTLILSLVMKKKS